ncbi:sugar phosphate isomerase/epimerase family protein [Terriglobus albidus]|uniref:sugar phosphate isomerase/epimerase family protein n=1 Tax=Terriglobus albidus TaxID=1592106 RepID=UPI0021E048D7|nr:sugar phosphate isomerase/epimerase family protein [Terriglobus albidus]
MRNVSFSAAGLFAGGQTPSLFQVGLIPAGKTTIETGVQDFWTHCDEVAKLNVRRIEFNNTRARIAEAYRSRITEFRDGMAARHLTMPGIAQFSHMGNTSEIEAISKQHLLIAAFMGKIGGKYITHMIAPSEVLNEVDDEEAYNRINLETWAKNLNEVARRVYEQHGVKVAYHPEQREVSHQLYERLLQATDERYVFFVADVGHIAAGGDDPLEICKKYRKRLIAVHLKDFSPAPPAGIAVKAGKVAGNVPFGEGIVDLSSILMQLKWDGFAGWVMGESGGGDKPMYDYMSGHLGLNF